MSKSTKNTILNENTIRRFMKLASIEPLAETFITEMEDESMMEEEDMEAEAEMEMATDADEAAEADETEAEAEEVSISDEEAEKLVAAHDAADEVADKLRDAIDGAGAEEEGDEAEEAGEEEMEMGMMAGDVEAEPEAEEPDMMEELYEAALSGLNIEIEDAPSKEDVINEVKNRLFQRVVNRLMKESKK